MDTDIRLLTTAVRETTYSLHYYLKNGLLEKVYENGLAHRLRKQGFEVRQQHPIPVLDEDGTVLGEYFADLLIDSVLIVELKAVRALANEHMAQVLAYLRATQLKHGILVNFGSPKLQSRKLIQ